MVPATFLPEMPVKRIHVSPGRKRRLDRAVSGVFGPTLKGGTSKVNPSQLDVDSFFKDGDANIATVSGSSVSSAYQDRVSWMGVVSKSVSNSVNVAGLKYAVSAKENQARR